ncbi:MAG: hypothetical protein DDT21_02295 [Syntrophomonadaceae bacterium]|nr:hypothetical protein [Bacillota bacterium]
MSDEKKFAGFAQPKENWSKLPHALIDELHNITSESELKVILYILRHTWGYHDSEKRITIDEFCFGRKRSDGSRIDNGCGITANSVKAGIENAVNHGYIIVEEDASDKARIKRFYSINSGGQSLMVGGQLLTPWVSKVDPRTEKDTIERNLGKAPLVNGLTAGELAAKRGKEMKYCQDYDWRIHRDAFEVIVDAMGKRALADADDTKTISDWQQVAVTLTKAGQTAETIQAKTPAWKESYWGKRDAAPHQFISFMGNDTPPAENVAKDKNVVQLVAFGKEKPW